MLLNHWTQQFHPKLYFLESTLSATCKRTLLMLTSPKISLSNFNQVQAHRANKNEWKRVISPDLDLQIIAIFACEDFLGPLYWGALVCSTPERDNQATGLFQYPIAGLHPGLWSIYGDGSLKRNQKESRMKLHKQKGFYAKWKEYSFKAKKNLNKGNWAIQRQDIMTTQRLAIDHINTCHKVSSALQISSLTYHPFSLGQIQRVLGVHCWDPLEQETEHDLQWSLQAGPTTRNSLRIKLVLSA